jgi:hypothetical protein
MGRNDKAPVRDLRASGYSGGVGSMSDSKDGAISLREPSLSPSGLRPSSRSHRFALRSTIAALLFVIGFPLVVWLALVVTP